MKTNSTYKKRKALYESIMTKVSRVVKNRLNEMSDELLDRAVLASVKKHDYKRAQAFSDYKDSEQRKNLRKPGEHAAEHTGSTGTIKSINKQPDSKFYIDCTVTGVDTKRYYGKVRIYTKVINPLIIAIALNYNIIIEGTNLFFKNDNKSKNYEDDECRSLKYTEFNNLLETLRSGLRGLSGEKALNFLQKSPLLKRY